MDWWIVSCRFKVRVRRIWQFWLSSLNALWRCHALSLQFDEHSCLTTDTYHGVSRHSVLRQSIGHSCFTTETGTHGSRTEYMGGASDSTGPPKGQLVGRPAVVQRQALMVLTVPVLVLTVVVGDLQRVCLLLSGSIF